MRLLKCLGVMAVVLMPMILNAAENNRPVAGDAVKPRYWASDLKYVVRFSTTVPIGTAVQIVSTSTFMNLVVPTGIDYSPAIASSTTTLTFGGRAYMTFQVLSGTHNVHIDFNTVDISTVSSPYLTVGQWWSPDDPVAWQGPVWVKTMAPAKITGWMWFDRPRTP